MTSTTESPAAGHDDVTAPVRIHLTATDTTPRTVCPEEIARVTDTAADLVVQGRRVTVRVLASLTGLDPAAVEAAVHELVSRGLLRPAGAEPHHYVFPAGRWPVGLASA